MLDILGTAAGLGAGFATGGIGALVGAVIRLIPALGSGVMEFFKQRADRKHELQMRELDAKIAREGSEQRIREADVAGRWEVEGKLQDAYKSALEVAAKPSGVKWVDALNAFVRPATAYYLLALYGIGKGLKIGYAWTNKASLDVLANIVWTPTDEAMLGGVIGFYFVDRQLGKGKQPQWTWSR
jgi:hypothetical protein